MPPSLAPRGRSSKYKIQRVIGRGSFGTAYLVRSQADSRLYVMKQLSIEHMNKGDRAAALNECVVMRKLRRHPNVIRVHEHFEEAGRLSIIMDYADGGDLAQRIEAQAATGTPFSEAQALDWFVQICLALKHAHDRKVMHRDLKPQNIFLTRMNLVRLGDFGISKVLSGTMSVASTCVGTPLYLAPELCEGKEYDLKCDVWAVGAILYEVLALQPPFMARSMPALVMRICGADPPPLPEGFSLPTRNLALEMLIKDPARRPRVHEVLERDFVKARIESFLDERLMQEEFSHTVFHNPVVAPAFAPVVVPFIAPVAAPVAAPRRPSAQPTASTRKPPSPSTAGPRSGAAAAPPDAVSDERARRQQRLAADQKREGLREKIRASRAKATQDDASVFDVEVLLPPAALPAAPTSALTARRVLEHAGPSSTPGVSRAGVAPDRPAEAGAAARPGTRVLSNDECSRARATLLMRQRNLTASLADSELHGEAARQFVNETQRQLLSIERTLAALGMPHVLVDEGAGGEGVLAGERHASIREEALTLGFEDDAAGAEGEPNVAVIAATVEEEEILADGEGEGEEGEPILEATLCAAYTTVGTTLTAGAAVPEELMMTGAAATVSARLAQELRSSLAWNIAPTSAAQAADPAGAPDRRPSAAGGIAFEISFDGPAKPSKTARGARTKGSTCRLQGAHGAASQAAKSPAVSRADAWSAASPAADTAYKSAIPTGLFATGSSLPTKVSHRTEPRRERVALRTAARPPQVETLRMHLEDELGGEDAFKRVYAFVLREESGECEAGGEREAILRFLGEGRRDLLPLVYTLAYMEDALSACGTTPFS